MENPLKLLNSSTPKGRQEHSGPPSEALQRLLRAVLKYKASDLHLKVDRPPLYRIDGKLIAAKSPPLSNQTIQELLYSFLNETQVHFLEKHSQVDCSFEVQNTGRFRANVYFQKGKTAAALRWIPTQVPSFETLNLPVTLKELIHKKRGLILITGSTGSGKSTTLASLVNFINYTYPAHIITIEDPIEFIYQDNKSSITQREIGIDAPSMKDALIGALRQDPDVIIIGEMRDYETIQAALTAAEVGHLVISTLHTRDAKSSITRILDVFPSESKNQVRMQLGSSLLAVISQKLLDQANGKGRIPVCEILIKSPTIEQLILNNELEKIEETIASSKTYYQMQTFNQALEELVVNNTITEEEALKASSVPNDLKLRLAGFKKEEN